MTGADRLRALREQQAAQADAKASQDYATKKQRRGEAKLQATRAAEAFAEAQASHAKAQAIAAGVRAARAAVARRSQERNKRDVARRRAKAVVAALAATSSANRSDPGDPTCPTFTEMLRAEQDPTAAQRLFHYNTNALSFELDMTEEAVIREAEGSTLSALPPELQPLAERIAAAAVTPDTKDRCLSRYNKLMHHGQPLYACGACGSRALTTKADHEYLLLPLSRLHSLQLTPEQQERHLAVTELYRPALSVHTALDGTLYHLHPELVEKNSDGDEVVRLCRYCTVHCPKGEVPPLSLAAGMDYASSARLGLPQLTVAEKLVISKARPYAVIVKLKPAAGDASQLGLTGHVISCANDGPEAACKLYPRLDRLASSLSVQFVGDKKQLRARMARALGVQHLHVRPAVVYAWLRALKALNPSYADIDIDESEEARLAMDGTAQQLLDNAVVIEDELGVTIERLATADGSDLCPQDPPTDDHGAGGEESSNADTLEHVHLTTSAAPPPTNFEHTSANTLQAINLLVQSCTEAPGEPDPPSTTSTSAGAAGDTLPAPIPPRLVVDAAALLSEFGDNDRLLYDSFPYLFMTGRGLGQSKSGLPETLRRHLLQQFTCAFAHDHRLIFALLDQLQRHKTAQVMAAKVKNDAVSFKAFAAAVADPEFRASLAAALKDPTGPSATKVIRSVMKYVTVAGADVPFSPLQRKKIATRIYSMVHRFGLPSLFLTISPDDTHSSLNIRCSFPSTNNSNFPATTIPVASIPATDFLDFMQSDQRVFGSVSKDGLDKLLAGNPVAAAALFQQAMEAVHLALFGIPAEHTVKSTAPFDSDTFLAQAKDKREFVEFSGGVFGKVVASIGVVEAQGRGRYCITYISPSVPMTG